MKLFAFALSLLSVLGAASTFGREYDVAYLARSPESVVFDTLARGDLPATPLASRSLRELFTTCGSVLQGLTYALQPSGPRRMVEASCAAMARQALHRTPTLSSAHAIQMLAATAPADIRRSLVLSQRTAPHEAWHAKLRLRKGLGLHGTGNAATDQALTADIAFLAQFAAGRVWLAGLYRLQGPSRPLITQVMQTRPEHEQAAFLKEVGSFGQI